VLVAAALAMKPGSDWFVRTIGTARCASLSRQSTDMLLQAVGSLTIRVRRTPDAEPLGEQVAKHRFSIIPTGTQFLHAVGCAEAAYRAELIGGDPTKLIDDYKPESIVYVSAGDGTTKRRRVLRVAKHRV